MKKDKYKPDIIGTVNGELVIMDFKTNCKKMPCQKKWYTSIINKRRK